MQIASKARLHTSLLDRKPEERVSQPASHVEAVEGTKRPKTFVELLKVGLAVSGPKIHRTMKFLKASPNIEISSQDFAMLNNRQNPMNSLELGELTDRLVQHFVDNDNPDVQLGLRVISRHTTMRRHLEYITTDT